MLSRPFSGGDKGFIPKHAQTGWRLCGGAGPPAEHVLTDQDPRWAYAAQYLPAVPFCQRATFSLAPQQNRTHSGVEVRSCSVGVPPVVVQGKGQTRHAMIAVPVVRPAIQKEDVP